MRDPLITYDINVNVIFQEIRILENSLWPAEIAENTLPEQRHSPNGDTPIRSIVTMDELIIIPADNGIVMKTKWLITEANSTSSTKSATFDKMKLTNIFKNHL